MGEYDKDKNWKQSSKRNGLFDGVIVEEEGSKYNLPLSPSLVFLYFPLSPSFMSDMLSGYVRLDEVVYIVTNLSLYISCD